MHRREYLATVAGASVGALAGCAGGRFSGRSSARPPAGALTNHSFEAGLNGWKAGADLPEDPYQPGQRVGNHTGVRELHASEGASAAEFYLDGVADDGTLWLQQPVDLSRASTLSVDVYSPMESSSTLSRAAAYAGHRRDDLREADFDTTLAVEDHAGWATHVYQAAAVEDGLVAVGISVVGGTEVTRWLDNVRLA